VTAGYKLGDGTEAGVFPPGIPIGEVSVVENDPSNLERVVYVRPYVDFTRLDLVMMVQWEQPDLAGSGAESGETP
jgi:cell shape-determining protein MreC